MVVSRYSRVESGLCRAEVVVVSYLLRKYIFILFAYVIINTSHHITLRTKPLVTTTSTSTTSTSNLYPLLDSTIGAHFADSALVSKSQQSNQVVVKSRMGREVALQASLVMIIITN